MRNRPLPETVQAQLLALGIPSAQHTADALGAFFPRELNVRAAELSTEDLARVLVYFATKKLCAVPAAGTDVLVKNVEPGWHACQFYRDDEQLLELVAPYIAEGLANDEGCLWVMPSAMKPRRARDVLSRFVDDVDARLAEGQLELLPHDGWYLDGSARLKSFEEIASALFDRQDRALAKGFKFLRAAGDTGWVSGTEQSREFIDYERKVAAAIGRTKVAAICTYRAGVTADELVAIVAAHQDAIYQVEAPREVT